MKTVKTKYFDYGDKEVEYLKKVDKVLGDAIERIGRVERIIIPDLFTALIYAIIGQLISVKAVDTVWNRMQERFNEITSRNISKLSADDYRILLDLLDILFSLHTSNNRFCFFIHTK
ncbi:hypothetical protein GKZ28_18040 [Clostridium chromiireducens]|uniref:Uncharacterized protein n=1 Tax=Clostridium chromiireducens TaxID=225345 RepID=A0A964RPZ5_9CLOT|nr:hypothetical protein [Clostridium chromiireducens]MVX65585.1 hypothetical protein [Clostridium chromiireducens]